MKIETIKRQILASSKEFKQFWQEKGPFKFALTSKDYPPVLLEPEEWIFSNSMTPLLKALMQYDDRKMKIVGSAFNKNNKHILRPETIIPWKIHNFPEEWDVYENDLFVPRGHLTKRVTASLSLELSNGKLSAEMIEAAFFKCLETQIDQLGYLLLKPRETSKYASIQAYLAEWEKDEKDAGLT